MRVVSFAKLSRDGSTLIELLIVLAIIAVLAGTLIVAINPKKTLADTKDAQRRVDMRTMIDALYQYQIDYDTFPTIKNYGILDHEKRPICSLTGGSLFFCNFVVPPNPERLPLGPLIPDYLAELPRDPQQSGSAGNCGLDFNTIADDCSTGYQLWLDEDGRIHVFAPLGDNGNGIEATR